MGRAKNDFAAILNGLPADYTARSLYFGAHYGYGYIKKLAKDATVDLYGKLLYTRQNGDSITTASVGLNYKERPDSNFSLGLNLTGYAGKRAGVSFNAQLQWTF